MRGRLAVLTLVLGLVGLVPGVASAATPELLWQVPEDAQPGSTAGRIFNSHGIAANQTTGHIYVSEIDNHRISEFTAWGEFVKAWGWGVKDGSAEAQVCTAATGCQKGIAGAGAGQLSDSWGVAIDSAGNLYVEEWPIFGETNTRVQKFAPNGEFLLMFGGEVNQTTGEDVCTKAQLEGGDVCGAGVPGTGDGEFSDEVPGARIAIGSSGHVFVGDAGRIQEFNANGAYVGQIIGVLAGEKVASLAMDSTGNFYASFSDGGGTFVKDNLHKLNPAGDELASFPVERPQAVVVDAKGQVYVVSRPHSEGVVSHADLIMEFGPSGNKLLPTLEEEEAVRKATLEGKFVPLFGEFIKGEIFDLELSGACGIAGEDIYAADAETGIVTNAIRAYGPHPDPNVCPPPLAAPTITDQYAVAASPDSATLKAEINPRFWPNASYQVEYGTGKCSEGGCPAKAPSPPASLGERVVNVPLTTKGVFLEGLLPDTTYRYRFIAQSAGGGPTVGVGPGEAEATFTTPVAPVTPPPDECPNAQLRSGSSAQLQDCRAYEMVSPPDKANGDILNLPNQISNPAAYDQASLEGTRFSYSTYRAFGDAVASPYTSQYLANRGSDGWFNHSISPPREVSVLAGAAALESQYRFFSPNLCRSWLLHDSDPIQASGAVPGYANLYEHDLCGESGYEALTTAQPQCLDARLFAPDLQGVSADGAHAVFQVRDKLTENAAPCIEGSNDYDQCYESSAGSLRLISVLPNGAAVKSRCAIGTQNAPQPIPAHFASVHNAISEDGSHVFWTDSGPSLGGPGRIYLRLNATQAQSPVVSGECTNPVRACTVEVSGLVSPAPAQFWTAARDGSRALFTAGEISKGEGKLYNYDTASRSVQPIASEVYGLVGASEDASRIYLASKEVLASGAQAGEPNLYLYEAGAGFSYVATLASGDVKTQTGGIIGVTPLPTNPFPGLRTTRVSPDGMHVAFNSTASLTGAVNTDAASGEPDAEVFVYDAESGKLNCASCSGSGVRPSGRELRPEASSAGGQSSGIWAASQIPGWPSQLYASRVLSEDGKRLFFESFQALVLGDTNEKQDVYEWEAPGEGSCEEGSPSYRPANGGCISLISSGESPKDTEFIDASADGSDVFFTTLSSLVSQDPGQIDVYDARVEGGFPPPQPPKPVCQGEACQPSAQAPEDATPASAAFSGAGNVVEKAAKKSKKHSAKKHKKTVHRKKRQGKHGIAH